MYKENYQSTFTRLKMSKANNLSVIISKIMLGIYYRNTSSIIIYFVSTVFLKINWGENLLDIFIVLICIYYL